MPSKTDSRRFRLAIVATHPIQYQTPLWRKLAEDQQLSVKVFYADTHGSTDRYDPLYGKTFAWDVPLLEGYEYEFLKSMRIPGLPGPTACRYPLGLVEKLAAGNFDVVMIQGYMNGAAWAGYLAARRHRLPVIIRGDSHLVGRRLTGMRARIKATVLKHFLRNIACCLAIGEWNRKYWEFYGVPQNRIHQTLFAVDNYRFRETIAHGRDEIEKLRRTWSASPDHVVFAFAGNLQPHKGVDVLIRAFHELSRQRSDVHLVLIGTGPAETELKALAGAAQGIHWTGFVNQSKMPLLLAAANVFVLPSSQESWGLVVNEAMACGLPCIVSDAAGAGPDLVSGPDTGLIFTAGNVEALRAAMVRACDHHTRTRWISNIPEALAAASFDANVSVIRDCVARLCAA